MANFAETLIQSLTSQAVEFIVVGGISAVLHGAPVVTQDIDLCYRRTPDNLDRLARVLVPMQPRLRGLPPGLPNRFDRRSLELGTNFTLQRNDGEDFDLLGEMSGIGGYDEVLNQTVTMEVAGCQVRVLSLEDLIRSKLAAGREKDLAVLPLLRATLEALRAQKRTS